jgi:formylglycine-generating enzyme required for sulfatase activity
MKPSSVIDYGSGWRAHAWKAPIGLSALLVTALIALAGCRAASGSISGNSGIDELLDDASYSAISPGQFVMGSPIQRRRLIRSGNGRSAKDRSARDQSANSLEENERPQRCVFINNGFALGRYEVTQEQWQAVMNSNPSSFKGPQLPVTNVSWNDAQEFLARLQTFDSNHSYRLPTEAEWEYACRAGVESDFSSDAYGSPDKEMKMETSKTPEETEVTLATLGWFRSNAFNHPHPVGQLKPNAWGLFDMHGNVREWCQDWYDSTYYKSNPVEDPQGPQTGAMKVNRGGSWQSPAAMCRSAARAYDLPTERNSQIGFRIVRTKK